MIDTDIASEAEQEQITVEIQQELQAKQVLDNPLFKRAFSEYNMQLFDEFSHSKDDEEEKRTAIYRQMKALNTVAAKLTKAIQTGSMARKQLTRWQEIANRFKKVIG